MNPEYASFLTLRLYEGTPMYDDVVTGRFERITADEIVDEMKIFLEHVDSPGTVFRTNHASNYVVLAGNLNEDIPSMLAQRGRGEKDAPLQKIPGNGRLIEIIDSRETRKENDRSINGAAGRLGRHKRLDCSALLM